MPFKLGNKINVTHNLTHSHEYKVWGQIKQRCHNANNPSYVNYGGRGIAMCAEWITFGEKTDTIAGWSKQTGIAKETIRKRLLRGHTLYEEVFATPHPGVKKEVGK